MDTGGLVIKDPQASNWPKGIDWTDYLAEISDSETISTSTWTITGADSSLTNAASSIVTGSKKTQTKLSGGTLGVTYTVTNTIVTSSSITDERSFTVLIEDQ